MHERASGLAVGWGRSPLEDWDCAGPGVMDRGALLPLDFP